MPAEWERHEATWLSWPHKEESWPGAFETIPSVFAQIARELSMSELVRINVADPGMAESVRALLSDAGARLDRVRFHFNPTNDAWARDHGPIYLLKSSADEQRHLPERVPQRVIVDWGYNAWGNKYPPHDLDDVIPTRIAAESGERVFEPGIVMEGGSIDVNGRGTLLTTESCLLNPNRNPQLSRSEIETYLSDYLGVTNILWLGDGIVGDDTDGHIDDLTRFVSPNTVVTMIEKDTSDDNHLPLRENLERLAGMKDERGQPLKIVTIQMPEPIFFDGQRLPASYANFYVANESVLVPTYGGKHDAQALETFENLFPGRNIVGINCSRLVWGLGAIHCVTQQQPTALP